MAKYVILSDNYFGGRQLRCSTFSMTYSILAFREREREGGGRERKREGDMGVWS